MTRTEIPVVASQLRAELGRLDRTVAKVGEHWEERRRGGETEAGLAAVAMYLHNFYNGIEKIFDRIARSVDESVPSGPSSHRDLLDQMGVAVAGLRQAVLADDTRERLRSYLEFRHRVRHMYFFDLEWTDVETLASGLMTLWPAVRGATERFLDALERAPG